MSLQDVLYLAAGSVLGVGVSLLVACLPEWLRMVRARNFPRERLGDKV